MVGPLERRLGRLRLFWLVAIGLLADLTPTDWQPPARINLAAAVRVARASFAPARRGRPPFAFGHFIACKWDDVAFRKDGEEEFCSLRCRRAFSLAPQLGVHPGENVHAETGEPEAAVLSPKSRLNLDFYDRRASLRKAERLTEREFAELMRTDAEATFTPAPRLTWIGINLAVRS